MKRILSLLLVLSMISIMFIGCGNADEGDTMDNATEQTESDVTDNSTLEETTLSVVFAGGDPLSKQQLEERIEGFMEENPTVTLLAMPSGSGAYLDFVKTKDAVGEFPDILEARNTPIWVRAGKLAPLPEETKEKFADLPLYENTAYIAPLFEMAPAGGVYYNKAMFDEYGLEEPQTYTEFLELSQTLVDNGEVPLVIGGKDGWHMGFTWAYYWSKHVFSDNLDWLAERYRGNVSFQDDNVKSMFAEYSELFNSEYVEKGWLSTGDNQIASFLVTGKAAMFISGPWMMQQIEDADPTFEYGWFPLRDDEGNAYVIGGTQLQGWALSSEAAEDPAKVAAFNAFMDYFYSDEVYAEYLRQGAMYAATIDKPEVNYDNPIMAKYKEVIEADDTIALLQWNNYWGENELNGAFRNYAYKAFQDMIGTGGTVDELTEALDKEWDLQAEQFNPTE
ncbi:extracellular solute-binding protein [Vallitaleaceae bacterium 9-2]